MDAGRCPSRPLARRRNARRSPETAHWRRSRETALFPDASWIEAPPIPDVATTRGGGIDPEEVASAQRWLIRSLAAYLGAFVVFPLLIALIPVQLWCLGRALRWSALSSASAITGTLVPCLGMAPLFIANQSATKLLRANGYVVGFWGARHTTHRHHRSRSRDAKWSMSRESGE